MDRELLKKFIETPSPVGREDELIKLVVESTKSLAEDYIYDNQGSVSVVYNKESPFKVMLMAHADEISLVVNGYNPNGTLKVSKNGGVREKLYNGVKVKIITEKGPVNGVVGVVDKDKIEADDLFVDIGCFSSEEAKDIVPLGSYVIHDTSFMELQNNLFSGRALDDRLGVFVIQEAAKMALRLKAKAGIYATSSVGEENTGRGAYSSSSIIKPDLAIIVDVTYSSDYIGNPAKGDINIGKGGVICLGSLVNRKLNKLLEETAKELGLPIQYEVWPGRTSTDGDTINRTNDGTPTVLFSIPIRYMHSPVEVASFNDVDTMIVILAHFLAKLSSDIDLHPYRF